MSKYHSLEEMDQSHSWAWHLKFEVKSVDLLGSACLGHSTDRCEFVLAFVLGLHVHSGSTWASGSVLTGCHHDVVVSVSRKSHATDKVEEVV